MTDSPLRRRFATLAVILLAAGCGGESAPSTAPEGDGSAGGKTESPPEKSTAPVFDAAALREKIEQQAREEKAKAEEAAAAAAAAEAAAAKPAEAPAPPAGTPSDAGKKPDDAVPLRLEDIPDREVLASWSEDEREALDEMSEEERKEFMSTRRRELFLARGGVLDESSGRMEDMAVDEKTGMRGAARPDAPPKELPPADLEAIIGALGSADPETRAAGAEMAKRYADPAVAAKHLVNALDDPDPEVRAIIIGTLGELRRAEVLPRLQKVLKEDRKDAVRTTALVAVSRIGGPDAIAILRGVVRESDEPSDRGAALAMLVESGKVENVKDLLPRAFEDLSQDVRRQAAAAVRTFKLKEMGPQLEPLLDDFSDVVTIEALRAMGELGLRKPVGKIVALLVKPNPDSDMPESIQDAAAAALKSITGEDLGYSGTLPEEQRLAAIDSWRLWWVKNKDGWR